jgi:hypothetical protein
MFILFKIIVNQLNFDGYIINSLSVKRLQVLVQLRPRGPQQDLCSKHSGRLGRYQAEEAVKSGSQDEEMAREEGHTIL